MQLSPNFSLEELTFSQAALRLGIDNTPSVEVIRNLEELAIELLEPTRDLLAVAAGKLILVHVDSGYRAPAVNSAIGGAVNSAHLEGRAADTVPIGMPLRAAFDAIRASALPFDQVILECNAWIHLAIARAGSVARRQALLASGSPGAWHYDLVA